MISTWFVADDSQYATFFPQIGARSDAPKAQAAYWRCVTVFFASSLAMNPSNRHVLFTNTAIPHVDGTNLAELLARWGVEVIDLPIRHRLPHGRVASWGNQFYVFDIVEYVVAQEWREPLVILDCDCVWRRPADAMGSALAEHGALTYELREDEHPAGSSINGLSREGMARFVASQGENLGGSLPYFGGEFIAARADMLERIAARAASLWPAVIEQGPDAPREEAHLLSCIYALEGITIGTGNPFIRRMWTTFHHHNLAPADRSLTVWHLPAEKRSGFAALFRAICRNTALDPRRAAPAMGLSRANIERAMGYPKRDVGKLVGDLGAKVLERIRG